MTQRDSNGVRFAASYTATVQADPDRIWAIWSDTSQWSGLDEGNLRAEPNVDFVPGSVVTMKLRSGQTVNVELKTVTEGEEFSDETQLPYGVVRTSHSIERSGRNVILTYAIDATVDEGSADAFTTEYWPNLLEGVPHQVHNVSALARLS